PPAFAPGSGHARYPALPALRDRLLPGATVVLDDIERSGEQEVLRRWEDEFGLSFCRHTDAGVAMATVP
ncbi:MAG: class I SAM-dependent methyltransferase, partial [Ilumatobacteraceae bacterium]